MTRKDYVMLAAAIEAVRPIGPLGVDGRDRTAVAIADALAADNPRFDRERFLKAAGVTE